MCLKKKLKNDCFFFFFLVCFCKPKWFERDKNKPVSVHMKKEKKICFFLLLLFYSR